MKMPTKARSIEKIIEEQIQKWHIARRKNKIDESVYPVVTISREPGSGGRIIAESLAEKLNLDLFHQEMIHRMAESTKVNKQILETLDEKGLNVLENLIASLVDTKHLWPDQYLKHLMKVILTIGKHGRAVIVGRGANFILSPESRFSVRVIASTETRIGNISQDYDVSAKKAKRRMIKTESDRRAFIRKYFNSDIGDPGNYDLIINTDKVSLENAIEAIGSAAGLKPG
jgi:cytidylate kinase